MSSPSAECWMMSSLRDQLSNWSVSAVNVNHYSWSG